MHTLCVTMSELIYRNELERLKQFKKELEYIQTHYQKLKKQYMNEFVAIKDEGIIAHDSDSRQLEKKLKKQNIDLSQVLIKSIRKTK
jgi:Family of unknown function (DUF5678)